MDSEAQKYSVIPIERLFRHHFCHMRGPRVRFRPTLYPALSPLPLMVVTKLRLFARGAKPAASLAPAGYHYHKEPHGCLNYFANIFMITNILQKDDEKCVGLQIAQNPYMEWW